MSLYLGTTKVSPVLHSVYQKTINSGSTTYSHISNLEDPDDIYDKRPLANDTWVRPTGWPNLDAISMDDDFEGVYFTYDNSSTLNTHYACFYCTISGGTTYTVSIGYLNSSNAFVASSSITATHNAYTLVDYSSMSTSTYPYVVIRLTPINANQHFTRCCFGRIPAANADSPVVTEYYKNKCLERRGQLKWVNTVSVSSTNYGYCTYFMQKDATLIGINNAFTGTNFASCWAQGQSLQVIDLTGWDTSKWTITSFASVFQYCYNILVLDLNCFNTTNWAITTIASAWAGCFSLLYLNVDWNTHNWRVTTLANAWDGCRSLLELNLNGWDTSNWAVTTLASTWVNCYSLRRLRISTWDTSSWAVTTLASTWSYCRSLLYCEVDNWVTNTWAVTTLASTWAYCNSLRNLDSIFHWNTANWAVTTLNSTWIACYQILKLLLHNWNTSNWKVTNLASAWSSCFKLNELKIGTWNVSQWNVTTLASMCASCFALEVFEGFQWNTPAWPITTIDSTFRYAHSIRVIDFSNWNCSAWALTTMAAFTSECRGLRKLNMSNINISSITVANNYGTTSSSYQTTILYYCFSLREFNPPSGWKGRVTLASAYNLPRSEVMKFFNNLLTNDTGTSLGIVIGAMRYLLSNADIAIATNKGYTIS